MSCLHKHSAQLEEVWLGGSCFYVHMEVTSFTDWKTRRVSLHFFTEGLQTESLQLSSQLIFRRLWNGKKQPQEVAVPKLPLQQVCEPTADGNMRRKDGQSSMGPFPAAGPTGSIHAPIPPSHKKELVTKNVTDIFLAVQDIYVQYSRKLEMRISILT